MSDRLLPTLRTPRPMKSRFMRQNTSGENPQPAENRPIRPSFRIKRVIQRPQINRQPELPEAITHNIDTVFCHHCHDSIPGFLYDIHLANCVERQNRPEDRFDTPQISLDAIPIREEVSPSANVSNSNDIEELGYQALGSVHNNSLTYSSEEILEQLANPLEDIEVSPIQHENQPSFLNQDPFSVPLEALDDTNHNVPNPSGENSTSENQTRTEEDASNTQEEEKNEEVSRPPRRLLISTIEPGPGGALMPRTRVISLDNVLNVLNSERIDEERSRIFGLLSLLANLQGLQGQFGDFVNLFDQQKGLDKEVLNELPVVVYTSDSFKNVDEESKRCTICLDCYENEQEVKFLWCMHRFHKNCVDQWLDKHTSCPFCKKDYSEALQNYE